MKKKVFVLGLLATALAVGLVLAGCDTGGGGDDGDGLQLPSIDEETTGLTTVTGSNISVPGLDSSLSHTQEATDGVAFSVADGKFSFTLSTPNNTSVWDNSGLGWYLFGKVDADYEAAVTPNDAAFALVDEFSWGEDNQIYRMAIDTNKKTYMNRSEIVYVYVSKDVTLSRAAKTWTYTDEEWTENTNWNEVNLALKTGWNLVQIDSHETESGNTGTETATVKIATNNVPWVFSDEH
jgi:hypothetical protein